VKVLSDSELLVKQIKGEYRIRNGELARLHREAAALMRRLESFSIEWVERGRNPAGRLLERVRGSKG